MRRRRTPIRVMWPGVRSSYSRPVCVAFVAASAARRSTRSRLPCRAGVLLRRAREREQGARRVGDARSERGADRDRRPRRGLDRRRRTPAARGGVRVAPGRVRLDHGRPHEPACTTRSRAPAARSTYHELDADVRPGEKHHLSVLEMAGRRSWWRVWVDGRAGQPADPPARQPRRLVPAGDRGELQRRARHLQRLRLRVLRTSRSRGRAAARGSRSSPATCSRIAGTASSAAPRPTRLRRDQRS